MSGPPIYSFMRKVSETNKFKYTNSVSALETITVPATGTNNFIIDWGDGSAKEHITTASPSHEFVDADSYQISISGTMASFRFNNGGSKLNVTSFDQVGMTGLNSVTGFAYGCSNCTLINTDGWDSSMITQLDNFARDCSSLTTLNVGTLDVSSVLSLQAFAFGCSSLTTFDVSSWDVSTCNNLSSFARGCIDLITLDVSGWNIGNVTILEAFAFLDSSLITLNTNSWDTRNITNCVNMCNVNTLLTTSFDEFRWWNRTDDLTPGGAPDPISVFTNCFRNAFNISNYADIPNNWKGL